MPALPPVSRVLRYDFVQSFGNNTSVRDRIFFAFSGTVSTTDLATLLATASAAWSTNLSPQQSTSMSLTSITGTDLTSNTGAQLVNSTAHAGTSASTTLATSSAKIIKFKVARRYRGGHPRLYFPPVFTADVSGGNTLSAGAITVITNAFAAFIAACVLAPPAAVGTLTHTNVSYFSGFHNVTLPSGRVRSVPTLRGTPAQDPVIAYSCNPKIGNQRRRNQQSS